MKECQRQADSGMASRLTADPGAEGLDARGIQKGDGKRSGPVFHPAAPCGRRDQAGLRGGTRLVIGMPFR